MQERQFTDPFGSKLPALERNTIQLRAFEMLLVIYYVEELKRSVVDRIRSTDGLMGKLSTSKAERVPQGTKNPVEKALSVLVADKAITPDEKKEIVELIDYRNIIGHELHKLLAEIGLSGRYAHLAARQKPYKYDALTRVRRLQKRLDGLYRTHHYVRTLNFNGLLFQAAERTLLGEIKRLNRKIGKLVEARKAAIRQVNAELSLEGTELVGNYNPGGIYTKYDDGRLTKLGAEICYRLFDLGKSPMAVAHLCGLNLAAVRRRRKMWAASGGKKRRKIDLAALPKRRFYRRDED
jgi:hypothetical protein